MWGHSTYSIDTIMGTFLYVLVMFVLVGTQGNASSSKEGDGILIDSEHTPNYRLLRQKETQLSDSTLKEGDCNDGDRKPNTESCKHYYECKNHKYVDKSCWWFWRFDSVSLECRVFGVKCAEPDPSPTEPTPTGATDSTPTTETKPGPEPTQPPCDLTTAETKSTPTESSTEPSSEITGQDTESTTEPSVGNHLHSYFLTSFISLVTIYFS